MDTTKRQLIKKIENREFMTFLSYVGYQNIDEELKNLTNLEGLAFSNKKPIIGGIDLSPLTNLKYLALPYEHGNEKIKGIEKLTNLETIIISPNYEHEIDLSNTTKMLNVLKFSDDANVIYPPNFNVEPTLSIECIKRIIFEEEKNKIFNLI